MVDSTPPNYQPPIESNIANALQDVNGRVKALQVPDRERGWPACTAQHHIELYIVLACHSQAQDMDGNPDVGVRFGGSIDNSQARP